MIIVWRGWGALVILFALLGAGLGSLIAKLTGVTYVSNAYEISTGIGFIVAGVALWFTGQYLNVTRAKTRAEAHMAQRNAEVNSYVENGTFNLGPGHPAPTSMQEARAQASMLLTAEGEAVQKALRNRNTLFWIPMQYWAVLLAAIGIILVITGSI